MSNMQRELDNVKQRLTVYEARWQKVRAALEQAEASGIEQRLRELQQENVALLGLIKELQAEKNRLSNQLDSNNEAAGLRTTVLHLTQKYEDDTAAAAARAAAAAARAAAKEAELIEKIANLQILVEAKLQRRRHVKGKHNNGVVKGCRTRLPPIGEEVQPSEDLP